MRQSIIAGLQELITKVWNIHTSPTTVGKQMTEGEWPNIKNAARLSFAREHHSWTIEEWKKTLFISMRERVWVSQPEKFHQCLLLLLVSFEEGSFMLFGGIYCEASIKLVSIQIGAITVLQSVEV
jgi:hypothetical protein